jgi:hypothetical protein
VTIDDFGSYPPSWRWNSETGELTLVTVSEVFEREETPIELNTTKSTLVMDMRSRERGQGHIEVGVYDMFLSPVGQPVPPLPPGEDPSKFKPAVGVNVWHPSVGVGRIETTATYYKAAIQRIWHEYAKSKEAADDWQPVIRFVGARQTSPKRFPNKTFLTPIIDLVGWLPRADIPELSALEPTVALPVVVANDSRLAEVLRAKLEAPRLEAPKVQRGRKGKNSANDLPNDPIPEL